LLALNDSSGAFNASSNEGMPPPLLGVPGKESAGESLNLELLVAIFAGAFLAPAFGAGFAFADSAASSSLSESHIHCRSAISRYLGAVVV
jgi:hypothetical protein